jgi:hypothetical protein
MQWFIVTGGLLCPGLIVAAAVLNSAAARRDAARRQALGSWAYHHGWDLVRGPTVDWGRRMPGYNVHGVTVAVYGTIDGRRVAVAEYVYVHTGTKSDGSPTSVLSRHVLMVVWLHRPGPNVVVTRRPGLLQRTRSRPDDWVVTTGLAPFDRAYRVHTAERALLPFDSHLR